MEYVMASRWSLMEQFEITDAAGTPQFEARGHLGSRITLHDRNGQEVAEIRKWSKVKARQQATERSQFGSRSIAARRAQDLG
ncbi:MAG: hypothetical protein J2P28_01730 [Actinobacteria bacterium]|nr:hypothetical protein [Actinomycetota bacterium]MBO0834222.1 hypothetical protein [Actinomycetota bacterium]